jgi:hypothetical protein
MVGKLRVKPVPQLEGAQRRNRRKEDPRRGKFGGEEVAVVPGVMADEDHPREP